MINATEFFETSVTKQRKILEKLIHKQKKTGDPVIRLPFDVYYVVEMEMKEAGWIYDSYIDIKTGKRCASFFSKEYVYPKDSTS